MSGPWTWTTGRGMTMGVGSGLGGEGQRGKKWDNCNSINNKILRKIKNWAYLYKLGRDGPR